MDHIATIVYTISVALGTIFPTMCCGCSGKNIFLSAKMITILRKLILYCISGQVKHLDEYEFDVDKGKFTTVARPKS